MRYSTILFDLDGTLTASAPGIIASLEFALKECGHTPPENMLRFVGPPLWYSLKEFCGIEGDEAERVISCYKERYTRRGMFENSVYEGVMEALESLFQRGYTLGTATGKYELYARRITDHFGLSPYLAGVFGSEKDKGRVEKADIIGYALSELGISDKSTVLMVGDRSYDAEGAKKAKVDCMGVLWGYGSKEELESAGVRYIASTPAHMLEILYETNS